MTVAGRIAWIVRITEGEQGVEDLPREDRRDVLQAVATLRFLEQGVSDLTGFTRQPVGPASLDGEETQ